ncbi:MAG: DCC1-like thiol-disulfide oxidoreductase family protein [Isosphaeraceae bacterium]
MHPIILFDGVCGLCNRFVARVLRHDHSGIFRFAPLQSELAAAILRRHGRDASELSTVVVVLDPGTPSERLLLKARAGLYVLGSLGGIPSLARPLGWLPTAWLDWCYDRIARNRYQIFGKNETCRLPTAQERARFLEDADGLAEGIRAGG